MAAVLKSQTLLVDDHPLFRAGLALAIDREPDLQVAAEVGTPPDAVDVLKRQQVDIAVVDVLMPKTNGISLATELLEVQRDLKVLALSVLDEPVMIAAMLRAGASGYALKTQPPSEIIEAVREVLSGTVYLPPRVSREAVLSLVQGNGERPLERLT